MPLRSACIVSAVGCFGWARRPNELVLNGPSRAAKFVAPPLC